MEQQEQEYKLKSLLTGQDFDTTEEQSQQSLETAKDYAHAYVKATNGIAVLSDLQKDVCYMYSGLFGHTLGIPEYAVKALSTILCKCKRDSVISSLISEFCFQK